MTDAALHDPANDIEILKLERTQVWERYKQLDEKDRTNRRNIAQLYILLVAFAAAPFTLTREFIGTAASRIWGFGGVWIACATWYYADRVMFGHGDSLVEKVLCIRQANRIREMSAALSPLYSRLSLLPVREIVITGYRPTGDPTHVGDEQLTNSSYFYKLVSFFHPLYLVLFSCLILFPIEFTDPRFHATRLLFLRVLVGFSGTVFLWLYTSSRVCTHILKAGYRARRIGPDRPWPLFPSEAYLHRRLPGLYRLHVWVKLAWMASAVLFGLNLVRLVYLFLSGALPLQIAIVEEVWWQPLDVWLAWLTPVALGITYALIEIRIRAVLRAARALDSASRRASPSPVQLDLLSDGTDSAGQPLPVHSAALPGGVA